MADDKKIETPVEEQETQQAPEIDLMAWAEEKNLDLDQFSEAVHVTSMILGLQVLDAMKNNPQFKKVANPTFRFRMPDGDGAVELLIRRVPEEGKIITPKNSGIITKH